MPKKGGIKRRRWGSGHRCPDDRPCSREQCRLVASLEGAGAGLLRGVIGTDELHRAVRHKPPVRYFAWREYYGANVCEWCNGANYCFGITKPKALLPGAAFSAMGLVRLLNFCAGCGAMRNVNPALEPGIADGTTFWEFLKSLPERRASDRKTSLRLKLERLRKAISEQQEKLLGMVVERQRLELELGEIVPAPPYRDAHAVR